MAIAQIGATKDGNVRDFIGLSTDTKPTTNLGVGSSFYEINKYNTYIWNGSSWYSYDKRIAYTTYKYNSLATTNINTISGASEIHGITICNMASTPRYLKLFDKATTPTLASDTPFLTIAIPNYSQVILNPSLPIKLTSGISFAITLYATDNDATVIGANEVKLIVNYK